MAPRILIIDDSDHLRTILKITLQFKNFEVIEAEDGQAGLRQAATTPCDMILCDIEMPVMNGLEFVRRYRAEFSKTTPILMLTAEEDEVTKRALAAGATAILHKPFEPIAMLGELEKYLV